LGDSSILDYLLYRQRYETFIKFLAPSTKLLTEGVHGIQCKALIKLLFENFQVARIKNLPSVVTVFMVFVIALNKFLLLLPVLKLFLVKNENQSKLLQRLKGITMLVTSSFPKVTQGFIPCTPSTAV